MDDIEALIEPKIAALRRYAFALTHDRDLADDLVQDCLEQAIRRWHLRSANGSLRAWLFSILHNTFVSYLRSRSRQGRQVGLESLTDGAPALKADQEERLAVQDALSGIELLPVEQRAVLLLIGVEEMTYAEAAHVLDIPIGTVMSRLSRGRENLRRVLESGHADILRNVTSERGCTTLRGGRTPGLCRWQA